MQYIGLVARDEWVVLDVFERGLMSIVMSLLLPWLPCVTFLRLIGIVLSRWVISLCRNDYSEQTAQIAEQRMWRRLKWSRGKS